MTAPELDDEDWRPDELLVPALMAGSSITMADLDGRDRAWAVAGMKLEGLTAEQIKDRLDCSLRWVRTLAAEPGAVFARLYMIEREAFARTLEMHQGEIKRLARALAEAERDRDRTIGERNRLIARSSGAFPRCGHPRTRYNTYRAPKTGKESCRRCHADAQARYEAKKAAARLARSSAG